MRMRCVGILCILALLINSTGCSEQHSLLIPPTIHVAVRVNPASYYWIKEEATGLDHHLLKSFAEMYKVKLKVTPVLTVRDALHAVETGAAHIAAGALTADDDLSQRFAQSPAYYKTRQKLLYHYSRDRKPPSQPADIKMDSIEVSPHPIHIATLKQLKQKNNDPSTWHLNADLDSHHLIGLLDRGLFPYTIADASEFEASSLFYPYVKVAATLSDEKSIVWFSHKDKHTPVAVAIEHFFNTITANRRLERLVDLHYHPNSTLTYGEKITFLKHSSERLPKYRRYFERIAQKLGLDWKLLATMAYQESNWDENAISPTQVKGIMMLTREISAQYQANRRDPYESIIAGSKYFADIKSKINPDTPEPDCTWMALAAYNLGWGHLQDALDLTGKHGGNPQHWVDVAKSFNLLQKKKWYSQAKHGKPTGGDAVVYVGNIRRYHKLLTWIEEEISTDIPHSPIVEVLNPVL